jgi:hypothetical protein
MPTCSVLPFSIGVIYCPSPEGSPTRARGLNEQIYEQILVRAIRNKNTCKRRTILRGLFSNYPMINIRLDHDSNSKLFCSLIMSAKRPETLEASRETKHQVSDCLHLMDG